MPHTHPSSSTGPVDFPTQVQQAAGLVVRALALPFDVARAQYAQAVQLGFLDRSMLASRDFSRALAALEQCTLGPWARRP